MSAWELTNITARLVLPPGGLILLGLIGLAFVRTHVKAGTAVASFARMRIRSRCRSVRTLETRRTTW